ncbi:MAG: flippase-like domain-containing protein, partial [Syntrophomonadaceae bacterium]|nr:flippase-like domain-containing protein [Syntrophomonadaceae bacterium]
IGQVPLFNTIYIQIAIYGILGAFLLLFAGIFWAPNQISNYLINKSESPFAWINTLRNFMLTLLNHVMLFRKKRGEWIFQFILSMLIWVLFPIKMFLLTLPLFPEAHFIYISAITFVSYMVAMLPIFPGGLGGFEGTMSGLLLIMGMSLSDSAVIAVVFRFVTFWFVILISLAFVSIYKAVSLRATL